MVHYAEIFISIQTLTDMKIVLPNNYPLVDKSGAKYFSKEIHDRTMVGIMIEMPIIYEDIVDYIQSIK